MEKCCENIDAYKDGELKGEEKVLFENHLQSCHSCCEELEWLGSLDLIFSRMPSRKPTADIEQNVLNALGFRKPPVWTHALGWAGSAAVGTWLVVLTLFFRATGLRWIDAVADGLTGISSFVSRSVIGLRALLDLVRPIKALLDALVRSTTPLPVPALVACTILVGLVAAYGLWFSMRRVSYATTHD
jgi:hypothetical protein